MPRAGVVALAVLSTMIALLGFVFQVSRPGIAATEVPFVPSAFQGALPIPETHFEPILTRAQNEARDRYQTAGTLMRWSDAVTYLGLSLTALVSLVAAFYGRRLDSLGDKAPERSRLFRLLTILVALSATLIQVNQQLTSRATKVTASAAQLNALLVEATSTLYDVGAPLPKAKISLQRLQDSIDRPW
jgi:hypothetical protein